MSKARFYYTRSKQTNFPELLSLLFQHICYKIAQKWLNIFQYFPMISPWLSCDLPRIFHASNLRVFVVVLVLLFHSVWPFGSYLGACATFCQCPSCLMQRVQFYQPVIENPRNMLVFLSFRCIVCLIIINYWLNLVN